MFGDGGTVTGIKTLSEGVQDGEGIESSGTGNTFSKNIFDNASFGIYLYSSEGDTVAYNIVKNSATGYYTDGVLNTTFIGNMANRNEYGYYIDGGGADLVTMIENTATGNLNNGFFVSMAYNGSDGSVFRNNTAKGNGTGTGSPGFHDEGSRNAVWRGNAAKANGDDGFELLNPRNVTFTNNRANRNAATGANFVDNDPGAGDNLADVSRNTATGNGSYGFYADFPAPGSDNKAKKNAAGNCFNVNC
jgi:parallel beta-helix repeat protein